MNSKGVAVERGLVTVQGVAVFSGSADPEERERAMNAMTEAEKDALKSLYLRTSSQVLTEPGQHSPAGARGRYVYNDDTGQAELRSVKEDKRGGPDKGSGDQNGI